MLAISNRLQSIENQMPIPKGIDPMKVRAAARPLTTALGCPTQARMRTVPAILSWKPRWSESQTSAGIARHSSSVRTIGRQTPTQPPRIGDDAHPEDPVPEAPADGRDEDDLEQREDADGRPRVVAEERERQERRDRPVDGDGADAAAQPADRARTRLGQAETLPRVAAGGDVSGTTGGVLRHAPSLPSATGPILNTAGTADRADPRDGYA